MNRSERVFHSRRICRKVTAKVNEISPPGLGHWPRTWDIVEGPSDRFLDALDAWTDDDTPLRRRNVETTVEALLVAWSEAARLFLTEKAPDGQTRNHVHA